VTEHLTLTVDGMTCGGCENAVKRSLGLVPGVANVTASHRDRQVTLDYDPASATVAAIAEAITRAGYRIPDRQP
jgi:copper chaperone CopZ